MSSRDSDLPNRSALLLAIKAEVEACISRGYVRTDSFVLIASLPYLGVTPPCRRNDRTPLKMTGCEAPAGSWFHYIEAWSRALHGDWQLGAANDKHAGSRGPRRFFAFIMHATLRSVNRALANEERRELTLERLYGILDDAIAKNYDEQRQPLCLAVDNAARWALSSVIYNELRFGRITSEAASFLIEEVWAAIEDEDGLGDETVAGLIATLKAEELPRIWALLQERDADAA